METIYKITLDNYHGEYSFELYRDRKKAYDRYTALWQEGCCQEEFKCEDSDTFSYFDANYNEYSTYIMIEECKLDDLFFD